MNGFILRGLPFLAGAALLSILVHILTLLILPLVAQRTAGQIMGDKATQLPLTLLPPAGPGAEPHPFADPAMVTALCPFDLGDGPLRVRLQTGETFLSLAVLSPNGRVLHALSDKVATRRTLDVVLVTEPQLRALEAQDPEDEPVQELRLRMSGLKGTVVLRAFAPRLSDVDATRDMLGRAQCRTLQEG